MTAPVLRGAVLVALVLLVAVRPAAAGRFAQPLAVTDARPTDGEIVVATGEWKLVFSARFNGGPVRWFDRRFDPGEIDNLATASAGGSYSQGVLFDYDVYLGTGPANAIEFMTTMGSNVDAGALDFDLIERTPARVRIKQEGHPRLNDGSGPTGNPFPELALYDVTTLWTIYPTGKVHIDFTAAVNPAGQVVDDGPGGAGKGIDATGSNVVTAAGGADFLAAGVWAGDTIESASAGWGPVAVAARANAGELLLAQAVPAGTGQSYTVRRSNIVMETISIHADGDPSITTQCADPATERWEGGSNGDPLWSVPDGTACQSKLREVAGRPPLAGDVVLAHWSRDRAAGSLLAFFEPWTTVNFGAFNDQGYTDVSYTQLGQLGIRPAGDHHRHFLAHMGSSASTVLPRVKSAADALPIASDYRAPFAEALVGTLATGPEIAAYGFDPGTGTYGITAVVTEGGNGREAVIRFDAGGSGVAYVTPAVVVDDFAVTDASAIVEISADAGTTWSTLDPSLYNLTGEADEGEIGAGRRVFQYLGDVPATAAGPTSVAFRFAGFVPPLVTRVVATALVLRDDVTPPASPRRRRFRFASRTREAPAESRVVPPSRGSGGDPTPQGGSGGGAVLDVYNASGSGEHATITLPASGWRSRGKGYHYRAPDERVVVVVRPDGLRIRAGGGSFGYTLDEPSQGGIAVRLALGTGIAWCAEAGAKRGAKPGAHDRPGRFVALPRTPPPPICPAVP